MCGIAFLHLKKPLKRIIELHDGQTIWPLNKIRLLIEKQRNRGQDGAGLGVITPHGQINTSKALKPNALDKLFAAVMQDFKLQPEQSTEPIHPFLGSTYLGHVRYGTFGGDDVALCQPLVHEKQQLLFGGNFNLTSINLLQDELKKAGIDSDRWGDTQIIVEHLALHLQNKKIPFNNVLKHVTQLWDGGYFFVGAFPDNRFFLHRDPQGIRPAFYYEHEDFFAAASERAALMGTFHVPAQAIQELPPGYLLTHVQGTTSLTPLAQAQHAECAFERIYLSRSEDPDIYKERKALGKQLAARVFETIHGDIENSVFCYVPNTSHIAFLGLVEQMEHLAKKNFIKKLYHAQKTRLLSHKELLELAYPRVRVEQVLNKNEKLRTFIADDSSRDELVEHIYNSTTGIIKPTDTIVVLDDSIIRGTTLEKSIMKQLIELNPKNIVVVSSCPPITYPDGYGIDMSQIHTFVAFRAAVALAREQKKEALLTQIYNNCINQKNSATQTNEIQKLYNLFTHEELEIKIAELILPKGTSWKGHVHVIYQTVEGLKKAIPNYPGHWYFTGDYPTPGGYRVAHTSFINWFTGSNKRAY